MTSANGGLFDLSGRVALVTGGNGGLGLGMALGLAEAGCDIAIAARNQEKNAAAVAAVESTGRNAFAIPTDVTSDSDIDDMVSRAVAHFGQLDILINNAGTTVRKSPEENRRRVGHCPGRQPARRVFVQPGSLPTLQSARRRQNHLHRQYVQHLWRRRERRPLCVEQGRCGAIGQEFCRGVGARQHPVQRHSARMVHDRTDPGDPGNSAGALRQHQPAHTNGALG